MATAPGNLATILWGRRLYEVGQALFAYSILVSGQRGFEGRIGLHVADAESQRFYDRLNDRAEGRLFSYRVNEGVAGPTRPQQTNSPNLSKVYLEADGQEAAQFLEGYRRE